jgi:hypothetical protein
MYQQQQGSQQQYILTSSPSNPVVYYDPGSPRSVSPNRGHHRVTPGLPVFRPKPSLVQLQQHGNRILAVHASRKRIPSRSVSAGQLAHVVPRKISANDLLYAAARKQSQQHLFG